MRRRILLFTANPGVFQGGDTSVREALTPDEVLNSFNEQFGDFTKDYYQNSDAFYFKAAKYFQRMLDAALLLRQKGAIGPLLCEQQWVPWKTCSARWTAFSAGGIFENMRLLPVRIKL